MNDLSSVVKVFPRSIDFRLPFGFVFRIALLSRYGKWYNNWSNALRSALPMERLAAREER